MKALIFHSVAAGSLAGLLPAIHLTLAADLTRPDAHPDLVFEEIDGIAAIEAEHFFQQTATDLRAWHIVSPGQAPEIEPDGDPLHLAGASGGAYLEILPDSRRNRDEQLIHGENFSNVPGRLAVISYRVHFNQPGRYYVWVRAFSSGSEDNGIHVGLNGEWPESGQRMQWCAEKNTWRWESKQRTEAEHCGEPFKIFLDIPSAGVHEIAFSMREDGFEFDKFILIREREFARPADTGPATRVKSGKVPAAFPAVAVDPSAARTVMAASAGAPATGAAAGRKPFPTHWGQPPQIQTMDFRPLPGGYGNGSSTMASWIQFNLDLDEARAKGLALVAKDFPIDGTGYYLHQDKWLAINPEQRKEAKAQTASPFPNGNYDITLLAVGENDGQSTYQVSVNGKRIGDFTAPLSEEIFEEGIRFAKTFKNVAVESGDVIEVASQIASKDGMEYSRARWAALMFKPADEATKAATASFKRVAAANPSPAADTTPTTTRTGPTLVQPRQPDGSGAVTISGELKQWHNVVLTVDGPFAHERDNSPNPFTDHNFTVTFRHESGHPVYTVPGYFATDGDAANSSAESGTKWRAHLSPDKAGAWTYTISFVTGVNAALQPADETTVQPYSGTTGSFTVKASDKTGRDFRAHGRLQYVGKHHLQFVGSGEYFLKAGPDAPETMLAYLDFDGTEPGRKRGQRPGEAAPT